MTWTVDGKSKAGILQLMLEGPISASEMSEFVQAHNLAIDAFGAAEYRVFCDIRGLFPLSPEAASEFEKGKAYSAKHANFQGSAVLVASKLVAMQHQRTSVSGGVMPTEMITEDEGACWAHLKRVKRG